MGKPWKSAHAEGKALVSQDSVQGFQYAADCLYSTILLSSSAINRCNARLSRVFYIIVTAICHYSILCLKVHSLILFVTKGITLLTKADMIASPLKIIAGAIARRYHGAFPNITLCSFQLVICLSHKVYDRIGVGAIFM